MTFRSVGPLAVRLALDIATTFIICIAGKGHFGAVGAGSATRHCVIHRGWRAAGDGFANAISCWGALYLRFLAWLAECALCAQLRP